MHFLARRILLGWLLTGLTLTAWHTNAADEQKEELKVGATAPEFDAIDDQGQTWLLSDHVGKKYLVVYFYPGDFTPGCTKQAQIVRDNMNKLQMRASKWSGSAVTLPRPTHSSRRPRS